MYTHKQPRPMPHGYDDVDGLLMDGYVTRLGLWLDANVWRGYSPTATAITNLADHLPARLGGWLVRTLGTANYFS